MNWFLNNYQWIVPILTTILGVTIGKLWDQQQRKKQQGKELKRDLLAENSRLKSEIDQIKRVETIRARYSYCSKGYYFSPNGSDKRLICSRCLDSDGEEINLIISTDDYFRCPNCNNAGCLRDNPYVPDDNYQDAQINEFLRYGK